MALVSPNELHVSITSAGTEQYSVMLTQEEINLPQNARYVLEWTGRLVSTTSASFTYIVKVENYTTWEAAFTNTFTPTSDWKTCRVEFNFAVVSPVRIAFLLSPLGSGSVVAFKSFSLRPLATASGTLPYTLCVNAPSSTATTTATTTTTATRVLSSRTVSSRTEAPYSLTNDRTASGGVDPQGAEDDNKTVMGVFSSWGQFAIIGGAAVAVILALVFVLVCCVYKRCSAKWDEGDMKVPPIHGGKNAK